MNLEQRLRTLEDRLITEPMVLYFADGSTRQLPAAGPAILALYCGILEGEERNPDLRPQANWIRNCIGAVQPAGGQMFDLLRVVVNCKTLEERWPTRTPESCRAPGSGR